MKKIITSSVSAFIFIFCISLGSSAFLFAGDKPLDGKGMNKPYIKEIEKMKAKKNGIFNLNLDIQTGITISNTKFDLNVVDSSTANLNNNGSKVGPSIGAILSVDFLGFGFTTGVQYSGKGFKSVDGNQTNLGFLNIPLLFNFGFTFTKLIIDGNIGPYFGVLTNNSNDNSAASTYKIKSFDFGITGNIEGAYMINKYLAPLLGLKYEYGGVNNLGNNEKINKTTTQTYFIYTGIKFIL